MENMDLDEAQKEFTNHSHRVPSDVCVSLPRSLDSGEYTSGRKYTAVRYRIPTKGRAHQRLLTPTEEENRCPPSTSVTWSTTSRPLSPSTRLTWVLRSSPRRCRPLPT